jgi:hypothetical protein
MVAGESEEMDEVVQAVLAGSSTAVVGFHILEESLVESGVEGALMGC